MKWQIIPKHTPDFATSKTEFFLFDAIVCSTKDGAMVTIMQDNIEEIKKVEE